MVLGKCALYVASVVVVGSAYGQFASPLVVLPPANTDPSCVRLYEQRTNGNNFVSFCAANAITTNNAITLPNLTAGGVLMAAPTAAAPVGSFYSTNNLSEVYKVCNPGSTFGTCWTLQLSTSQILSILNQSGGAFADFNSSTGLSDFRAGGIQSAGGVVPSTNNTFDSGSSGLRWRSVYFDTSVIQGATTRINSSGNFTMADFTATSFTGDLLPSSSASQNIGGANRIGTIFTDTLQIDDGSVLRVTLSNPGAGSNTGAGIIQRNAAGTIIFRTFYNGNIETAYTGGGTVVACLTAGGVFVRGVSTTSC